MDSEEFSQYLAAQTAMTESDIKLVYEFITCTTSATPTLLSVMETLVTEAPRHNDEQQARLRALDVEDITCISGLADAVEAECVDEQSVPCTQTSDITRL